MSPTQHMDDVTFDNRLSSPVGGKVRFETKILIDVPFIAAVEKDDPSAEEMHASLCAMKLAQRSVHPLGSKYLLSKRGVDILPIGRTAPQKLRPETLVALDYAARTWFAADGALLF